MQARRQTYDRAYGLKCAQLFLHCEFSLAPGSLITDCTGSYGAVGNDA